MTVERVIAIDWSGAKIGAERKIWRADVVDGELAYLRNGFAAREIAGQLIELAKHDARFAVGFDFSFSMPAWFLEREGIACAPELWARVADGLGEQWLRERPWPFWGRAGSHRPVDCELYRQADRRLQGETGFLCKSAFQIAGAGAAGTGSLRGMPLLHDLRAAGFRVWPYDEPGWPIMFEIYPRVFTGAVRKSNDEARARLITDRYGHAPEDMRRVMASNEDAFDAGVSALEMWRHRARLAALPAIDDPVAKIEGTVWYPEFSVAPSSSARPT